MELRTGTVVGRYVVEGRVGSGGVAVVYKVREVELDTAHALKLLSISSADVRARLRREGEIQGDLIHPNLVGVHETVVVRDMPGLVMEFIEGPTLRQVLEEGSLTLEQCDQLAKGLIAGVAAAHGHGVVHRDLKPANVLLALGRHQPTPKVGDFGLAKALGGLQRGDGHATRSGDLVGTPAYMSPEQVRDSSRVGPRSDVFSLGAILYEMLTGRPVFVGDNTLEVLKLIEAGEVVPARELRPEAPERMLRAIEGALQLDPEDRIPDAEALLAIWTDAVVHKRSTDPLPQEVWSPADMSWLRSLQPVPGDAPTGSSSGPAPRRPPALPMRPDEVVEEGVLGLPLTRWIASLAFAFALIALVAFAAYQVVSSTTASGPTSVSRSAPPSRSKGLGTVRVESESAPAAPGEDGAGAPVDSPGGERAHAPSEEINPPPDAP